MRTQRVIGITVLLLPLVLAVATTADEGRKFTGFYELADPTDMVSEVAVTFTADIFNYSGADCYNATFAIVEPLLHEEVWGTFHVAYIADRDKARVSGDLVASSHEYEQWQQGATPHAWLDCEDAEGNLHRQMVELSPMLLVDKEVE